MFVDAVRCAGVALGLWGAWLTAPSGAALLLRIIGGWLVGAWRWFLNLLPWRRSQAIHPHGILADLASATDLLTVKRSTWDWPPSMSVDEQVELLRARTAWLDERIHELRDDARKMVDDARAELSAQIAGHAAELSTLQAEMKHREELAAVLDAAGLPVIGVAIVLSGLPDSWVRQWLVGWLLLVVAAVVAAAGWYGRRRAGSADQPRS